MTRYLIGALAAIIVIGVLGYIVYSRAFTSAAPAAGTVPAVEKPRTGTAATLAPPKAAVAKATRVVAVTGGVEKRAGAQWVAVQVGDELSAHDTIRTREGARATLDIGALVEVDDRTELTVGEISSTLAKLALTEGRISANAGTAGGVTIRISTRDTDAVAETDRGRFDVLSSGKGQVTVAVAEGDVSLKAHGTTVVVPAGTLSTVQAGTAPTTPREIPGSLFLKVSAAARQRDRTALRGETTPGAVVSINNVRTSADARGVFTGEVALSTGPNTIVVSVEDATGRREHKVLQRTVGPAARPRLETEVQWQ